MIQPERHPRHHDNEEGWDVDGDDVIRDLALESHVHSQAAVTACGIEWFLKSILGQKH